MIRAMIAIEIEMPDPNPHFPPPNEEVVYGSIADLYYATLMLSGAHSYCYRRAPVGSIAALFQIAVTMLAVCLRLTYSDVKDRTCRQGF